MSREQIKAEARKLKRPGSRIRCVDDADRVIVILEPYRIPVAGIYSHSVADALAFLVPVPYPEAQPDASGFYVRPTDLSLVGSKEAPRSTAVTRLLQEKWLKFSWATKGLLWDPSADTLATYLATVEKRFQCRN